LRAKVPAAVTAPNPAAAPASPSLATIPPKALTPLATNLTTLLSLIFFRCDATVFILFTDLQKLLQIIINQIIKKSLQY